MHEVAEPSSRAFPHFVLTAAGFAKVGNRRKFGVNGRTVVPSVVQIRHRLGGVFLLAKFDVHVANLMIGEEDMIKVQRTIITVIRLFGSGIVNSLF